MAVAACVVGYPSVMIIWDGSGWAKLRFVYIVAV